MSIHASVQYEDIKNSSIVLTAPGNHYQLKSNTVVFQWEMNHISDSIQFIPEYYEVMFWSKHRDFSMVRTVYPGETNRAMLRIMNASSRFKRHGRYYWQVHAVTQNGQRFRSDVREFIIPVPKQMQSILPAMFPYAIKWQQTKRLNEGDFKQLVNSAYPKIHLQSHSDLCLIFRQPFIGNYNLDLEEHFLFNSNVGLGGGLMIRWRLYENLYFALHPAGRLGVCWYATGLERFSSLRYETFTGCDFIINPKGYVSSNIRWVPVYRFHYTLKDDGFRVFEGRGWEWGIKIVIPRTIMTPFKMLGIEMDFERMPIEYTYSRIKDDYTGVTMPTQEIGISFLFQ
ncbi:hypothetical protein JW835_03555 [bacterium]|nr:hypothetical protein [bacterium]RQV98220.1 MAG: hypothetical protein EH221_02290 [bacterium]